MRTTWIGPFAAIVGLVLIVGGYGACKYNSMVRAHEDVDGAWAQVENVLQRRADLIPNLVETVKGYAQHERDIFTEVAQARSRLIGAQGPRESAEANQHVSSALSRLLAISERYPDLKANQNFMRLQDELAGTENRIAVERKRYNDEVRDFNKQIAQFPNRIFASMFGFDQREYFEAAEGTQTPPEVRFGSR
ncbi:MAG TPA: LemA family protein [Kofleriaceae bacterium]|nr:LemA family protein [Kofleriaceae bacterium]